jgi:hypothetical protein
MELLNLAKNPDLALREPYGTLWGPVKVINYTGAYTYPRPRPKALGLSARDPLADRERPRGGALRATFRMLCCPFRAYRGCGSVVGDPMTDAHGLVALPAARMVRLHCSQKRRVRRRATARRQGTAGCP